MGLRRQGRSLLAQPKQSEALPTWAGARVLRLPSLAGLRGEGEMGPSGGKELARLDMQRGCSRQGREAASHSRLALALAHSRGSIKQSWKKVTDFHPGRATAGVLVRSLPSWTLAFSSEMGIMMRLPTTRAASGIKCGHSREGMISTHVRDATYQVLRIKYAPEFRFSHLKKQSKCLH